MLLFITLQAVCPALLLCWLAFHRPENRSRWLVGAWFVLGVVAAISLAVPWIFVPSRLRYFYLAAWGLATWWSGRRMRPADGDRPRTRWRAVRSAAAVATGIAAWTTAGLAVDGRRTPPGDVVDLACPLGPGTYLVVNGGSRRVVNAHLIPSTVEASRGLRYGVDLIQVDGFGRRAAELASPNPADYRIYGAGVFAPCDGRVVTSVDGRPDRTPPHRDPDRTQALGNHIVVQCGPHEVLLTHLQPGSVRVRAGEMVRANDLIGFVGNSGDTSEPHLHVSAQRRSEGQPPVGGDPISLRIGGAFLVRNDRLTCR